MIETIAILFCGGCLIIMMMMTIAALFPLGR